MIAWNKQSVQLRLARHLLVFADACDMGVSNEY